MVLQKNTNKNKRWGWGMEMKERRNPKAKHDEYTSELIPHG